MPRKKKEEEIVSVENAAEVTAETAAETAAEAPVEKPKRGRRKKAETETAAAEEPKKTTRTRKTAATKTTDKKTTTKKTTAKTTAKKTTTRRKKAEDPEAAAPVEAAVEAAAQAPVEAPVEAAVPAEAVAAAPAEAPVEAPAEAPAEAPVETPVEVVEEAPAPELPQPRRSIAFIGSECYPFVKTGGLGDVMYALPKALIGQNCDVKVILPRYKCIPQEYQDKMVYVGAFDMDLCADGKSYYVGIMEYVWDGVVYDFIDNEEFFSSGNPYTNLIDDIPKFCYFGKAALAALNYMNWIPDVIHCHDWQAGLVPVYLRTLFDESPVARSKVMITIHNLRFQGLYDMRMIKYWSGLPDYVFNKDALKQGYNDANMFKGGLTYANMITTVSGTYADEIQTPFYGENLDAHLRYHSSKLRGIINGIDYGMWDPATDSMLAVPYDLSNVLDKKKADKLALQEELGLEKDEGKFVIGLISRLTNQKGLDLVNAIIPDIMDGNTQLVILGTGDAVYEDAFRYYENAYKGSVCSNIMYDEGRSHKIYAGVDALLVPSQFEPCGLTQLIAMHYGTVPIVRETGGLKDTVEPYNEFTNEGNGFTFDRYEAGLLLDAINRAKTLYFTNRYCWDEMVQRDMAKDVSWENSAKQYRALYVEMTQ
ncbi:MAG: glycogen synthase [Sarcina sp.]|nr:glycogen synthase [Sarcina sp.]